METSRRIDGFVARARRPEQKPPPQAPTWAVVAFGVLLLVGLAVVVASGQPVNNQTILEGFRQATDLTVGGLLDSVDTSKDGPIEEFPRMMNTKLIFEEVQDGQITMLHDGEFIDVGPDIEKVQ